ncbi:2-keto-4-pentenoate hydratase [Prauserella sp. PE36]|uniref:2-keto-4-pentenoate hydratase n=1 Tax=Prauserella sp. PE36 TaxID=1504709 RepID=UPI000D83B9C0|nr:2-keto-4-pentenoate hydratase [Prauserella sp. PE36]PXY23236.1 2-keto-4-pentenoate hydratase [Prauserella coralliicola]RBM18832.1 2-keto-4-pentenoate hydratase [Prauserella sp. PE36]
MTPDSIRSAAASLLTAYQTGKPIDPLSDTYPHATVSDAYRMQLEQVRAWTQRGEVVVGHKVGLVSAAIRRQMRVAEPDYGHLTSRMIHPEHEPIPSAAFLQPRVEPELAFVLKAPLRGPHVTVADAARAVEFVLPALEIVDSRIADWRITIVDTIADNASSGGFVLGSTPVRLDDADLRLAGCVLTVNGAVAETGAGAAVLGSPLNALAWLANTLAPMGIALEPGHIVLSGSMTRTVPIAAGDCVVAAINGFGSVTAVLSE